MTLPDIKDYTRPPRENKSKIYGISVAKDSGQMTHDTFLSFFAIELGGSFSQLSIISSIRNLGSSILTGWWGAQSDKHGRKPYLLLGNFALLLSILSFLVVNSVNSLIVLLLLQTLIGSAAVPVWISTLGDLSSTKKRGEFIGKITGLGSFASILTILIAGQWMDQSGLEGPNQYRLAFGLSSICFIIAIILIFSLKESLKTEYVRGKPSSVLQILRESPAYRRFIIIESTFFFAMSVAWPLFSFVTKNVVHATNTQISLINTTHFMSMAAAMRVAGSISDRIGRKPVLISGRMFLFVVTLLYALAGRWPNFMLLVLASVFGGASGGLAVTTKNAIALDLAPPEHRASFSGIVVMVTGITSFVGSLFGGALTQLLSVTHGETNALILMMYFATVLRFFASFGYLRLKETAPAKTYTFPLLD